MSTENQKQESAGTQSAASTQLQLTTLLSALQTMRGAMRDIAHEAGDVPEWNEGGDYYQANRQADAALAMMARPSLLLQESVSSKAGNPLVYIEAHATTDEGDSPSFASLRVGDAFRGKLLEMKDLLKAYGLSEVRIRAGADWGPGDIEDELRLEGHELVVAGNTFWFTAYPKHGNYSVETKSQEIDTFVAATSQHEGDEPLRFGDLDDDEWEELLSDSVEHDDEKGMESEGVYDGEEERAEAAYLQQQRDRADQFTAPEEDEPDPGLEDELESMRP